jgi:hypothetical protein
MNQNPESAARTSDGPGLKVVVALIAAALISACQTTPVWQADGVLARMEVQQLFVGNTVESHNLNTRLNSFTYYHPDGTAVQERLWKRRLGRWSIADDGQICLAFGKGEAKCRRIVRSGGRYYKERLDPSGRYEKIVRYRYFSKGNALADN